MFDRPTYHSPRYRRIFLERYIQLLTLGQVAHFKTFGFLLVPQLFSESEIARITKTADDHWLKLRDGKPIDPDHGQGEGAFVEQDAALTNMVTADRIYGAVESILGSGFLWAGSEGNVTVNSEHPFHPDRSGDEAELAYTRLKINLYLDPITEENGCLRVIPGSHRMPLHGDIEPDSRHQRRGLSVRPFDVPGPGMPSISLESNPGDAIFFNQSLWHAIFNGWAGRRYIALKFAAKPETDKHLASLHYYSSDMFEPHSNWATNEDLKVQSMVGTLPALGAKKVPDFVPFRDDRPAMT